MRWGAFKEGLSMTRPILNGIAPFFIVRNARAAVAFYRDRLGFDCIYQGPEDDPFLAIVCRDGAMLMVKAVGVNPAPNRTRHPAARWDAYINVPDPDALATEFTSRGVMFSVPLEDTSDGLRGFELKDADGYVLFFGRPRENSNRDTTDHA
jgi:catechol 2,3-dioxygenase-like lactoylglutathione lyase family enzyme